MLEDQQNARSTPPPNTPSTAPSHFAIFTRPLVIPCGELDVPRIEFGFCEAILQWPCLSGLIPEGTKSLLWLPDIRQTALAPDLSESSWWTTNKSPEIINEAQRHDKGILDGSEVVELVKLFTVKIYPRAPILDIRDLQQDAAEISESGWQWDPKSCKVVSQALHHPREGTE